MSKRSAPSLPDRGLPTRSSARAWVFGIFIVLVFALGGGSRFDIVSLSVLRPLSFGFLIYALLNVRRCELAEIRVPLVLLISLAGWICLQLVPLPPSWWQTLPGREVFAEIYSVADLPAPWLSLSMAPSRTLNALFSLVVPIAAMLLFVIQSETNRRRSLILFWALAVVSVLVGIAQYIGPTDSVLYFYRVTNDGLPVGLFANRNHQALFVAIGILLAGYLLSQPPTINGKPGLLRIGAGASLVILVPFLLIAGSRGGLLLGLLMAVAALLMVVAGRRGSLDKAKSVPFVRGFGLKLAGLAGLLIAVTIAFIAQSRSLALERLLATGQGFELREEVWPSLLELAQTHWLLGTGFGGFEFAFKQVEGVDLLRPAYLNQAHQDWVQLLIEGGLPATIILVVFLAWLCRNSLLFMQSWIGGKCLISAACCLILFDFALASLADYPLRVPSLMLVFAIACAGLSVQADARRKS